MKTETKLVILSMGSQEKHRDSIETPYFNFSIQTQRNYNCEEKDAEEVSAQKDPKWPVV